MGVVLGDNTRGRVRESAELTGAGEFDARAFSIRSISDPKLHPRFERQEAEDHERYRYDSPLSHIHFLDEPIKVVEEFGEPS